MRQEVIFGLMMMTSPRRLRLMIDSFFIHHQKLFCHQESDERSKIKIKIGIKQWRQLSSPLYERVDYEVDESNIDTHIEVHTKSIWQ